MKKSMAAKIMAVLVTILFFSAFSAYGAVEGQYTLFGVTKEGYTVSSEDAEMRSVLVLTEDGKGSMTMDDETMGVSEWAVAEKEASMMDGGAPDSVISVTLEDGSTCSCAVRNGILELDVMGNGEMLMLFAMDGADRSAYQVLTVDELLEKMQEDRNKVPESNTRLYMVWQSLDQDAGIHMSYSESRPAMGMEKKYEVFCKNKRYCSSETTSMYGYSRTSWTYCQDGKVYSLDPEKRTAQQITEIYLSEVNERIFLMDPVLREIYKRLKEGGGTTGVREVNGVSYAAEIFPASEYSPEVAFCFTEDGRFAYYLEGAPVIEAFSYQGETIREIHSIDRQVDESLLDISGYTVTR